MALPDVDPAGRHARLVPDALRPEDRGDRLERIQADPGAQQRRAKVQRRLPPDPRRHRAAAPGAGRLARGALRPGRAGLRPARQRPGAHDLPGVQLLRQAPALHRRCRRRVILRGEGFQAKGSEAMSEQAAGVSTGTLERIRLYAARNERNLSIAFFAAGFLFDIVTLGRIDSWATIGQQAAYLVLVTVMLVQMLRAEGQPAPDLSAAPKLKRWYYE